MAIIKEINKIAADPSSVYLIVGRNNYFENEVLEQVKKIIPDEEKTMNYATYDMETTPVSDAINDANSLPFFGEKRVVIIQNAFFLTGSKHRNKIKHSVSELESYLKNVSNDTVLVIFAPYEKLDGRKKITKLVKEKSTVIDFNTFSNRETVNFIKKYIENKKFSITDDALNELSIRTQGNLSQMINELSKVFIYCNKSNGINLEVIDKLVVKSMDQNIFALVDDLMQGKITEAIQFYHQLLIQNQDPIKINALLESQFRLLLQVKILSQHNYSQSMITKALKIHPYRVKLAQRNINKYSLADLQKNFINLIKIECKLKSSRDNPELLFEMFAIQFGQKKGSI